MLSKKFTAVAGAAAETADDYFQNVTMLLSGDGTNGAQNNTFLDSSTANSGSGWTITRNGNTAQGSYSPYGPNWSVFFDNTGDYVDGNVTMLGGSSVSTFTIDGWIFPTTFASTIYVIGDMQATGGINYISLNITTGGLIQLAWYDGAAKSCTSTGALNLNQWNYFAIRVSSNAITAYVNSATSGQTGTTTLTSRTGTNNVAVGAFNGSATPNAYLSNLRVSTVARTISVPTDAFANDADTRLLMFQSNRFINNGSTTATLTPAGNPSVQRFSPFNATAAYTTATIGGSGYFDGTGDYLTGSAPLVPTTSTSTFTLEGWIYPTTFANIIYPFGDMNPTGGTFAIGIQINTSGVPQLYWYDGAVKTCSGSAMVLNQWNYFAFVVNANAITAYVNSTTASQSGTTTLTNRTGTNNFAVGQFNGSTTPNAYISDLRCSTVARTIAAIPTTPLASDANTRVLLSFTNAGIYDSAMMNDLETVGGAQISTSVKKYGTGSIYFDGSGDFCVTPSNPSFDFGSGNFTIECWAYPTAWNAVAAGILSKRTGVVSANQIGLEFSGVTGAIRFAYNNGGSEVGLTGSSGTLNTWQHIAVVRNGSTLTIYKDGTSIATATISVSITANTANFAIGAVAADGSYPLTGYIDDLRITKGYARYTSNFTAPTAALPNY